MLSTQTTVGLLNAPGGVESGPSGTGSPQGSKLLVVPAVMRTENAREGLPTLIFPMFLTATGSVVLMEIYEEMTP